MMDADSTGLLLEGKDWDQLSDPLRGTWELLQTGRAPCGKSWHGETDAAKL